MTQEEKNSTQEILKKLKQKCSINKQIHSNKKKFYDVCATTFNVITIIASVLLTIIGFMNKDTLFEIFMNSQDKTKSLLFFDFIFNSSVTLVLVLTILNLIYRFQDKSFEHNRAIILFSNLLNEISDVSLTSSTLTFSSIQEKISQLNYRYSSIIDSIPSNSDKDYLKAKEDYYSKRKFSNEIDNKYNNA